MLRCLHIITLLLYFAVNTGFTVHSHYCMGEWQESGIGAAAKDDCGRCGMPYDPGGEGCCDDEEQQYKLTQQTLPSYTPAQVAPSFQALETLFWHSGFLSIFSANCAEHSPLAYPGDPPYASLRRHLQLRVLRI